MPVGYEVTNDQGERAWWDGKKLTPLDGNGFQSSSRTLSAQERASVADAQNAARGALDTLPDINRFDQINAKTPTGGLNRWNDAIQGMIDPNMQQMNEISARLTPAQRQPGSGTTSDRDLALFQQAVPSRKNTAVTNSAILERARAEAVRRQQYADFLDDYAAKNGTLNGAETAFRSQVGLGTRETPYEPNAAGDRSQLPRGAYYTDPQGNLRRNDNGPRGNPIVRPGGGAKPQSGVKIQGAGWKVLD